MTLLYDQEEIDHHGHTAGDRHREVWIRDSET
jgi:hypothetical protein